MNKIQIFIEMQLVRVEIIQDNYYTTLLDALTKYKLYYSHCHRGNLKKNNTNNNTNNDRPYTSFEPKRENWSSGSTWAQGRKKVRTGQSKKVTKS